MVLVLLTNVCLIQAVSLMLIILIAWLCPNISISPFGIVPLSLGLFELSSKLSSLDSEGFLKYRKILQEKAIPERMAF